MHRIADASFFDLFWFGFSQYVVLCTLSLVSFAGVSNAIMVLKVDITPFAKQAVQEMSDSFRMEHFKESELLVDITQHQLVPQHQVLTAAEKAELLKRYRLKDTQLPRIQPNDPIARYYGMKRGQVVKIIRPSETAGRYVTYRVCM